MTEVFAADYEINPGEIRVITGSRLHFGLLRSAEPFGGVGAMIGRPSNVVSIAPADQFQCDEIHADRILPIVERLKKRTGMHQSPACSVNVRLNLAAHCGLGSGTQLSLAIADGLCRFLQMELEPLRLATEIAGRGKRSAVGIHGYFQGGLIHEGPVSVQNPGSINLNAVHRRIEMPESWCVAFMMPTRAVPTVSGEHEAQRFAQLGQDDSGVVRDLRACLEERLVPAAETADFASFCEAVHDYNRQSGLLFKSVQGGPYNGEGVTSLVESLRSLGILGVGQSSWGPGVFAWFESRNSFNDFSTNQVDEFRLIAATEVQNCGRRLIES